MSRSKSTSARLARLRERAECRPEEAVEVPSPLLRPVVDRSRCEGKRDCVEVCPYDVFEVRRMDDADFERLGWLARLKSRAHGRRTAYVVRGDACRMCGLCVVACPERAIQLRPVRP